MNRRNPDHTPQNIPTLELVSEEQEIAPEPALEEQISEPKPRLLLTVGAPQMMVLRAIFMDEYEVQTVLDQAIVEHQVAFGSAVGIDQRSQLMSRIQPLTPKHVAQASDGGTIASTETILTLAAIDASDYNLRLKCNTEVGFRVLHSALHSIYPSLANHKPERIRRSRIRYGGASEEVLSMIVFLLKLRGIDDIDVTKKWGDDDLDIWIDIRDPMVENIPFREWLPVAINADTPEVEQQLISRLQAVGFNDVRPATQRERAQQVFGFAIDPNMLSQSGAEARSPSTGQHGAQSRLERIERGQSDLELLRNTVTALFVERGISVADYPLQITGKREGYAAVIHVPFAASAGMLPYGGDRPGAYPVTIRSDDLSYVDGLCQQLRRSGFNARSEHCMRRDLIGPSIRWGQLSTHAQSSHFVNEINRFVSDKGFAAIPRPIIHKEDDPRVIVTLPSPSLVQDISRAEQRHARRLNVVINIDDSDSRAASLQRSLRSLGFRRIRFDSSMSAPGSSAIHFGGAPTYFIAKLVELLDPVIGEAIETEQVWGASDQDIFIFLPAEQRRTAIPEPHFDVHAWLNSDPEINAEAKECTPFLNPAEKHLCVGPVRLVKDTRFTHSLTPTLQEFSHYCLDSTTCLLLERIAEAVLGGEPLLLEGVTATSKTSSILYLAAHLGQPVLRVNLSGTTDVSEFVGRFVPNQDSEQGGWKWEDGPVVKAMTEGHWLILDELNLAEAAILERLNSILERHPKLVLTEHNDRVVGGPASPVHPRFRIFGTQNPETYSGRNPLSPAYRDRFHETHVCDPNLDVTAIRCMLHQLAFSRSPSVTINGISYASAELIENKHSMAWAICEQPDLEQFLDSVAVFHVSICSASSSVNGHAPAIGADKSGGYAFTRRGLIRLLQYLARKLQPQMSSSARHLVYRQALTRTYLERVDPKDASKAAELLDAAGIGPKTWVL